MPSKSKLMTDIRFVEIAGGPHVIGWTQAEEVNAPLLPLVR